jgi:1-acyl-sn-glycerol-3-phosphate acyltransferase
MNAWVPPRVVRRVVVDPLWLPLAAALALLFAALGLLGLLAWPLTPRRRVPRVCALALTYLWLDCRLLVGSFAAWLRAPTRARDVARWQATHCAMLRDTLETLLRAAGRLTGFHVVIEPGAEAPPPDRPLIVLARHGGPGDSFALVDLLLGRFGRRPRVVLKRALQWDPGLDVVLTRLAGCFLPSRSGAGEDQREDVTELAEALSAGDALLLFPVGGNWPPRRHRRAVRHLLRTGRRREAREARRHPAVLPPRPGGTLACLRARPDAAVVVVAHGGLDTLVTPRQIWQAVPLQDRPMRVTWWLCDASSVPREPELAEEWLRAQWSEVDARVAALGR